MGHGVQRHSQSTIRPTSAAVSSGRMGGQDGSANTRGERSQPLPCATAAPNAHAAIDNARTEERSGKRRMRAESMPMVRNATAGAVPL